MPMDPPCDSMMNTELKVVPSQNCDSVFTERLIMGNTNCVATLHSTLIEFSAKMMCCSEFHQGIVQYQCSSWNHWWCPLA
jgi:hypothetical protein